jgi:hypothetical protein
MPPQQSAPIQRPIFSTNPLNYMISNEYSGTLNINNLNHINRLYEMMVEALQQETNLNMNINPQPTSNIFMTTSASGHKPTVIFTTTNTQKLYDQNNSSVNKPKTLFGTIKGKKIFNIIKEPNPNFRRKQVKIIYKNDEEADYPADDYKELNQQGEYVNYEYEEVGDDHIKQEEYYEPREDEYLEDEENKEDGNDNIFESTYPSFLNIFK